MQFKWYSLDLPGVAVDVHYTDYKRRISQYILLNGQDDCNGVVINKLHAVQLLLGDWQTSCRRCRKEGNVLFNDALNTFYLRLYGRKEGNVLFNDALNTFYLRLYGRKEGNVLFNDALKTFYIRLFGRKEMFYLTTHSKHFICGYMEGRKEMFYLTTHSTHFIFGYLEGRKCFI